MYKILVETETLVLQINGIFFLKEILELKLTVFEIRVVKGGDYLISHLFQNDLENDKYRFSNTECQVFKMKNQDFQNVQMSRIRVFQIANISRILVFEKP